MYDYFRAADDETAKRVGSVVGGPVTAGHADFIETKWVDPTVRMARLHFRVQGRDWELDGNLTTQVLPVEPIGPDNWDEPTVHRLSDEVRDSLASVGEDERVELGRWWASTEEFVLDRADPALLEALCAELLGLCRDARDDDDHVYVWSSL